MSCGQSVYKRVVKTTTKSIRAFLNDTLIVKFTEIKSYLLLIKHAEKTIHISTKPFLIA